MSFGLTAAVWVVLALVGVVGVMCVLNRNTGAAVLATVAGATGVFGTWLRNMFPNLIIQYELDKAAGQLSSGWKSADSLLANINGWKRRVDTYTTQSNSLDMAVNIALRKGDEAGAKRLLTDKKGVDKSLDAAKQTLDKQQEGYNRLKANLDGYEIKIRRLNDEANRKKVALKTAKAEAALSKQVNATNFNDGGLQAALDNIDVQIDNYDAQATHSAHRNGNVNLVETLQAEAADLDVAAELEARKKKLGAD